MSDIALLKRQHAEILAAANDLDRDLAGALPDPLATLIDKRMRVARLISQHLQSENELLYEPLRRHGLIKELADLGVVEADVRALRLAYSEHIQRWTVRMIAAEWHAYADSSRQLNRRMQQVVRRKETLIYPPAERLLSSVRAAA